MTTKILQAETQSVSPLYSSPTRDLASPMEGKHSGLNLHATHKQDREKRCSSAIPFFVKDYVPQRCTTTKKSRKSVFEKVKAIRDEEAPLANGAVRFYGVQRRNTQA